MLLLVFYGCKSFLSYDSPYVLDKFVIGSESANVFVHRTHLRQASSPLTTSVVELYKITAGPPEEQSLLSPS